MTLSSTGNRFRAAAVCGSFFMFSMALWDMRNVYLPSAWVMVRSLLPELIGALVVFISQAGAPLWSVKV